MGGPMCKHLLDAGHECVVNTRTRSRARGLLDAGARWADTPRQAALEAEVVFTMVGYPSELREVVFGDQGVLADMKEGAILVDLTTSEPALAREIAQLASAKGIASLDAPVTGGDVGAREGTLSIMVGGDPDALEKVRPLLECFGKRITYQGPAGMGQETKAVNQILIASCILGVCEGLVFAKKAGLDLESVLSAVGGGGAASWSLTNYGPRMLRGDLEPGFLVEHFVKDLGIALQEARRLRVSLPGTALANELYASLMAAGSERKGIQALIELLAELSHVSWPSEGPQEGVE